MLSNVKSPDYDCTRKCRLRAHGNQITAALTKRSMDDDKLAAFIAKTCCNFMDVVDDLGRSAVHLAASVDRYAILEWLINQDAIIAGRDFESGSSPLHRALYYGCIDCAILLMRYGASVDLLDEDTRCPLQSICRYSDLPAARKFPANNEILVWGSNKNYNLGIDNEVGSNVPLTLDYFRKEHINIASAALGVYHSLFLDNEGALYAVGHGKGGRLGIGKETSLTTPKRVKVPYKNGQEVAICISASRNHSLLLTNNSTVYACGLNDDKQLGLRDIAGNVTSFKEVVTLRDHNVQGLRQVIACDYHSMAYSNDSIYMWGSNNGQLGLPEQEKLVPIPKKMRLPKVATIDFVESNNAATAVYTKEKVLLFMSNYKCKMLTIPKFEPLKGVCIVGGDIKKANKGTATALKMLCLSESNVVFVWYENTQQFYRCIFGHIRISQIDKIFFKANQVLILSQGDVYKGKCQQVPVPSYVAGEAGKRKRNPSTSWYSCDHSRTEISQEHMICMELERIASVDRAVDIFCNDEFNSFAVLQESHMKYFRMPVLSPVEYNFRKLYEELDEMDSVHDVVFQVDGERFAAHRFIVFSRAPGLAEEVRKSGQEKDVHLNMEGLSKDIFQLLLRYIYSNQYPNEQELAILSGKGKWAFCKSVLSFSEKFGMDNLTKYLKSCIADNLSDLSTIQCGRFDRLHLQDLPELYDVRIVCEGDVELQAHKCVLVARLEYFNMMFTHNWSEQTMVNLSTVPAEYMRPILEFLYSSDVVAFRKQNHSEKFLYNMIVFCDQFFIERLRTVCELLILDKINIRKCGEMLEFACMYHCELLQKGCMDFICQNLARVLLFRSLNCLEAESLSDLNKHYRNMFQDVFSYRMITPDADAIEDELLLSFVDDFEVDLDYRMDEDEVNEYKKSSKVKESKEKKSKTDTRHYEREAISNMMEQISLKEGTRAGKEDERSKVLDETQEIAEKLQADARSWTKVSDKKEPKRNRLPSESAAKTNDILKAEEKITSAYVSLNRPTEASTSSRIAEKTPEREILDESETPKALYDISLAELATPPHGKLSQKQRKRLSSGSAASSAQSTPTSWRSPGLVKPFVPQQPKNAWGDLPQSPPALPNGDIPAVLTGTSGDPTSFANMARGKQSSPAGPSNAANSFSTILAEERRQRDYYDRQKNKSLALTQIEETAIAELRQFYNVDNVTDEIITIERKQMPQSAVNFAVWQRN